MQKKKSTKNTRNAEYRKLKDEFERYVQYNTVQRKYVRDAENIARKNKELADLYQKKLLAAELEIQRLSDELRAINIDDSVPMNEDDVEQALVAAAKLSEKR